VQLIPEKGVIFLFIQYMKNFKRVIIACVIMLLAAAIVIVLLRHRLQQGHEEREFSGMFVRGVCSNDGHLYQTQEKGDFIRHI